MMQIPEQSYDEKLKMLKKLSKDELAKMLIESNRLLEMQSYKPVWIYPYWQYQHPKPYEITYSTGTTLTTTEHIYSQGNA